MKTPKKVRDSRKTRKGAVAAITALLLVAILGLIACALDIGYIEMTRTQLQAAADASSLAAGTELLPGLGYFKTKTPDRSRGGVPGRSRWNTPVTIATPNWRRPLSTATGTLSSARPRLIRMCNCWGKTPASEGAEYYNYVEVTPLRNQAGSTDGDGPAPLFFARIFGFSEKSLRATATAAILPANGFRVNEGSDDTANVMPFAFKEELWDRF